MLTSNLDKQSKKKLNKLLEKHNNDYKSLINSLYDFHINQLKRGMQSIKMDMAYFENKYGMLTKDFYERFKAGDYADENNDYLEWSGEYEILLDYEKELKELEA
ncbi:MAG: hypothetical protein K9J27_12325 [Bacteroidales bacterium]|nr:hypothetical protein [Bacteroidales bacterium]